MHSHERKEAPLNNAPLSLMLLEVSDRTFISCILSLDLESKRERAPAVM